MRRRGEIAISVVVVIALGLLVLVMLAVLLNQGFRRAETATSSCQDTYSGACMAESDCRAAEGRVVSRAGCEGATTYEYESERYVWSFPQGGTVCCVTR